MKLFLSMVLMVSLGLSIGAGQGRTVSGIVSYEDNSPAGGITIEVEQTGLRSSTMSNGYYFIIVSGNENILEFTKYGYETVRVKVGNQFKINIIMERSDGNTNVTGNANNSYIKDNSTLGKISQGLKTVTDAFNNAQKSQGSTYGSSDSYQNEANCYYLVVATSNKAWVSQIVKGRCNEKYEVKDAFNRSVSTNFATYLNNSFVYEYSNEYEAVNKRKNYRSDLSYKGWVIQDVYFRYD